jgi:hypothetical protein
MNDAVRSASFDRCYWLSFIAYHRRLNGAARGAAYGTVRTVV